MSSLFLINILLALVWGAISGSFSELNLLFGFVLGMIALFLIREQVGTLSYLSRVYKVISLIWLFLYELVLSAVRVAKIAMQPKLNIRPGFFIYELKTDRDAEITLLANLITLTPGTLSVDVSDDKKRLFIHAIDIEDIEAMRVDIEQGFERKIMEALR
ncbi:Na+/H+ antiporter subunit E [Cohaesibacter gelatinilyticus]|uniref:Multicomponent Na+:H+ antiporter subunit E n=1 Tax=Cohaesibacter gelatinilyticus TaxID=372072 RepID=A0A285NCA4_9HYPH|nr:Na+/H+ antiporter subunit E [Cohaesibacter gelatinilyticus]SNZ07085.1 multicomponent Na+:H+ antiporter subunit E [Cohaesibacter gelatinilyticus]